jgi:hypothetical protein
MHRKEKAKNGGKIKKAGKSKRRENHNGDAKNCGKNGWQTLA